MGSARPATSEGLPALAERFSANGSGARGDRVVEPRGSGTRLRCDLPLASTRIECDFRHSLVEPAVTHGPSGDLLTIIHGQERVTIAISRHGLLALWAVVGTAVARRPQ